MALTLFKSTPLERVFTPGGQPSITYVNRAHLGVEAGLRKAIALPTTVVSLTGPTKSGKTVLCKTILAEKHEFVWVDGGEVKIEADLWRLVCSELKLAAETTNAEATAEQENSGLSGEASLGVPGTQVKFGATAGGSLLKTTTVTEKHLPDNARQATEFLIAGSVCLVIDDFHYIPEEVRADIVRAIKGPVFRGLKVILLSTPHRAFEATKAESEITGRFKHVTVPAWTEEDLRLISSTGFKALNVLVKSSVVTDFVQESEGSPLLMQRFCWNLCYDAGVTGSSFRNREIATSDLTPLFSEVAEDAGLPIYERLSKGPQSRTDRIRRPLADGGDVDIYEAILLAVARTGPKQRLSYDQIRASLSTILADKVPQKLEVSNALNHLATIANDEAQGQRALDWDNDNLDLFITDPFFRFYLRWAISGHRKPVV